MRKLAVQTLASTVTLLIAACSLPDATVAPLPGKQQSPSPSLPPTNSPEPRPYWTPNPNDPLVFPSPRPSATVSPEAACPGDTVTLIAAELPAQASMEIWIRGLTPGGWKIPNPPSPTSMGATKLGTAMTDSTGRLSYSFALTDGIVSRYERDGNGSYDLWLIYPTVNGKTPIQPTATVIHRCPSRPIPGT
jgi:hypothetical protein